MEYGGVILLFFLIGVVAIPTCQKLNRMSFFFCFFLFNGTEWNGAAKLGPLPHGDGTDCYGSVRYVMDCRNSPY